MNNGDQLKKANETHLHHTALMLACQDLESATYAARKAREDLRRATRNRRQAKERHDDAHHLWLLKSDTPEDALMYVRVEFAAWVKHDAEQAEKDALEDYRSALKRIEVLGATAGEADSHEVPAYVRHRARKAIALADAFGNKVAMDATLHDGLDRPVLPELEPEVEVQEFRVIDPLEPVEAWTAPDPRAVLVPVDDYEADGSSKAGDVRLERDEEGTFVPVENDEDPAAGGWKPEHMSPEWWKAVTFSAPLNVKDPLPEDGDDDGSTVPEEDRMDEGERAAFWREVNHAQEDDAEKVLEAAREDAPRLCPECRDGKHGNCDGDAWDDANDWAASCECTSSYHENER